MSSGTDDGQFGPFTAKQIEEMATKIKPSAEETIERAKKILVDGLKYHEHDGHDMPKRVAREALEALGVKREDQP